MVVFDCTCNTQNSMLLNQHNGDDAPQEHFWTNVRSAQYSYSLYMLDVVFSRYVFLNDFEMVQVVRILVSFFYITHALYSYCKVFIF